VAVKIAYVLCGHLRVGDLIAVNVNDLAGIEAIVSVEHGNGGVVIYTTETGYVDRRDFREGVYVRRCEA
jgi:hypothetical protein